MTALSDRMTRVATGGCFLAIGAWDEVALRLAAAGWKGLWIQPHGTKWPKWDWTWDVWRMEAELSPDPHFAQTLAGHFVRGVTIQEVFNQFPGPYNAVLIDWPMLTRRLFHSPQVQLGKARMVVVPEDGHNEEVRRVAAANGYRFDDSLSDHCFMYW